MRGSNLVAFLFAATVAVCTPLDGAPEEAAAAAATAATALSEEGEAGYKYTQRDLDLARADGFAQGLAVAAAMDDDEPGTAADVPVFGPKYGFPYPPPLPSTSPPFTCAPSGNYESTLGCGTFYATIRPWWPLTSSNVLHQPLPPHTPHTPPVQI